MAFFLFFGWDLSLNSGLCTCKAGALLLKPHLHPFWSSYFGSGVSQTICLGWPGTVILPISASQITRITGMSHLAPSLGCWWECKKLQMLWKILWQSPQNKTITLWCDSASLLMSIYPKKNWSRNLRYLDTHVHNRIIHKSQKVGIIQVAMKCGMYIIQCNNQP
jgi:hypothetical protein